jgi:hypothetical protein
MKLTVVTFYIILGFVLVSSAANKVVPVFELLHLFLILGNGIRR